MKLQFEWDKKKEMTNIKKHGIDFETAANVFYDDNRIEKYDYCHSIDEDRYITIGTVNNITFVVMVAFTERGSKIRIISARKATTVEKEEYYDNYKNN